MKYLSARQVSELWGISPRRVTLLASQGRIRGAGQIGGRWFIPEGAGKPGDPRRKKVSVPESEKEDSYFFPFLPAVVNSEEQIARFSPEETALWRLCTVTEAGDFPVARELAEALLPSENRYVRLGALYQLPMICMYLADYAAAERYTVLFRTALQDTGEHREELKLLQKAFDSEMSGISEIIDSETDDIALCPEELLPYTAALHMMTAFYRSALSDRDPETAGQELICRLLEPRGYFFCTMLMHLYLSFCYSGTGDTERELTHLRRAAEIGISHGTFLTLALFLVYNPETAARVLGSYPPGTGARLRGLSETVIRARSAYAAWQGRAAHLSRLSGEDYRIISLCFRGCSIAGMAAAFGLSASGMKKRLSVLYGKLGVKSKSELLTVYLHAAVDWE